MSEHLSRRSRALHINLVFEVCKKEMSRLLFI